LSIPGIHLESVRLKTGGRVHSTPKVPRTGPVTTLCGKTLAAGSYVAVDGGADCASCVRRSRDPSRISSAFFEQEEGSQLLRLSLEQARFRRPDAKEPRTGAPRKPVVISQPPPVARVPDRIGELVTAGFKSAGLGVWTSPAGVVVRMSGQGRTRFAELVFEGAMIATREDAGLKLCAGDVEVLPAGDGVEVRIRRG
jgi:hypothetical protein